MNNDISESNYNNYAADHNALGLYNPCTFIWAVWVVIYVKYITYEGLLHNTLALDVDTVQEACIQSVILELCEFFFLIIFFFKSGAVGSYAMDVRS